MKNFLLTVIALAIIHPSFAQWINSGSNIYNSNSGYVGIGTTSPLTRLHIVGNLLTAGNLANIDGVNLNFLANSAQLLIAWNRKGGTGEIDFIGNRGGGNNGGFAFYNHDNNNVETHLMSIQGDGNVGIGTVNPGRILDIQQSVNNHSYLRLRENSVNTETDGGALLELTGTRSDGSVGYYGGLLGGRANASQNNQGYLSFYVDNNDGRSLAERMRINNAGNVGIGTTSPGAVFDVGKLLNSGELGSVLARLSEGNSSGGGTYLGVRAYETQPSAATPALTNVKSFSIEHAFYGSINSSINFLRGGGSTDGALSFNTLNNTERMRISSDGNIGIGTTAPDAKLAVNGTIHSKEVKVDLTGFPDYVFKPAYNLRPLSEVKAFINQNQHLPDMPSAKEVEANGLNLGEMNKLLTKKVEELTLYLIQKDKELSAQRSIINQQQQELDKQNQINHNIEVRLKALESKN